MAELARFKSEINLTTYAASLGFRLDRRESSRNCVVMRHPTTDDKIIVSRGQHDGHWTNFSVPEARDHGTIVDFIQRRGGGTLGAVRRELLPWISDARPPVPPQLYVPTIEPRTIDRARATRLFEGARVVATNSYLKARGIRPAIQCSDRFAGTFREDRRGNVLFPHRDGYGFAGFEWKNHGWTSFSAGGVRGLWCSNALPGDKSIVLVESAIDALSFDQVQGAPRARYASTVGTLSEHQRGVLAATLAALPPGTTAAFAFDRDPAGDKLAEQVRTLSGRMFSRDRPSVGKDWSEHLQMCERENGRLLAPSRGPSRGR